MDSKIIILKPMLHITPNEVDDYNLHRCQPRLVRPLEYHFYSSSLRISYTRKFTSYIQGMMLH